MDATSAKGSWWRMLATAAAAVALTLCSWVLLVSVLDRRLDGYENLIWSGTLWFSALLSTGLVACSKRSCRPVLSCTLAFGLFGVSYMLLEGLVFGIPEQGGDLAATRTVAVNLASLPIGVFAAAEVGSQIKTRIIGAGKVGADKLEADQPPSA